MTPEVTIRDAGPQDIPAITEIYAYAVRHSTATYEEVPPDAAEMERRFAELTDRGFPYLVAEQAGTVLGFAYGGPFRMRVGYRFTVEDSVYLARDMVGKGIGRALLATLIARCTALGYRQMVAVVGDSANLSSIRMHESQGFRVAGTCPSLGFKFGNWRDFVLMQRPLGDGDNTLPG